MLWGYAKTSLAGRLAASLALLAAACGEPPQVGDLFDPNRVLTISIEMDPNDWETIRNQSRSFVDILAGECLAQPFESPFTYVPATVTVDGVAVELAGVRKKGFIGSLDTEKPSLKVDFAEFLDGQRLGDTKKMTLNNSKQDPSFVRQCVTYQIFANAGYPAPRCNFATVEVNGESLGLYVHVEEIKKPFLEDNFLDDSGNLYEGTLSDFRPGWTGTFEEKTNEETNDSSELLVLTEALAVDDTELIAALDPLLDLDAYFTFWALEVLTNHWDGYANNNNNFHLYRDPASQKFIFLPWGTDGALLDDIFFLAGPGAPRSVFATGQLARRLYLLPETQAVYLERLQELLGSVWDEAALLAEIDRMEDLIAPLANPFGGVPHAEAVEEVREFIRTRRQVITDELAGGPPPWPFPPREEPCLDLIGQAFGTFSTTFGTLSDPNPFLTGTGTLDVLLDGVPLELGQIGANAGFDPNAPPGATVAVQILSLLPDGTVGVVVLGFDSDQFQGGSAVSIDFVSTSGVVAIVDPATGAVTIVGLLAGDVQLDQAGTEDGAVISGSFSADLVVSPF